MLKTFILTAALLWTGIVLFLCLTQSSNLPVVNIENLDKFVHGFFHFMFTLLWVLFFKMQMKNSKWYKPLIISFVFSVFFGVLIEILQKQFTTTRNADIYDILANICGSVIAILFVFIYKKSTNV